MNTLKKMAAILMTAWSFAAGAETAATVSGLHLAGEVKDGMLGGRLAFRLDNVRPGGSVPVLGGSAAIVSQTLPAGMTLLPPGPDGLYRIAAEPTFWGGGRSGRSKSSGFARQAGRRANPCARSSSSEAFIVSACGSSARCRWLSL